MKRNKVPSKKINRMSRRDSLPLLRGMFISLEPVGQVHKLTHGDSYDSGNAEEGLILTAKQGMYLEG